MDGGWPCIGPRLTGCDTKMSRTTPEGTLGGGVIPWLLGVLGVDTCLEGVVGGVFIVWFW